MTHLLLCDVKPNFYPRSPCGERLAFAVQKASIPYFYPRSPCGERLGYDGRIGLYVDISIHALLAESDCRIPRRRDPSFAFLSTLSLRRATGKVKVVEPGLLFLSTLSLRRATNPLKLAQTSLMISIHALLAESDNCSFRLSRCSGYFYPRSPCGERLLRHSANCNCQNISIHALLAESDYQRFDY